MKTNDPLDVVIHYILRWSGKKEDETPLCGSRDYSRTEVGTKKYSNGKPMLICEECKDIAKERGL